MVDLNGSIKKIIINLMQTQLKAITLKKNSSDGYILEVDLEYSDELQELHNDYSLALEKLTIIHNMLSNYCCNITNYYGTKISSVNKLVPNLGNKSKYVLHYKDLQLYLSLEMKLVNIHRILKSKQLDWLKTHIDINTDTRKNVANSFEKDFYKLMNNSVYGKTMENLTKRINVRLIISAKDYKKYVSKQSFFFTKKIFSENVVTIHRARRVLTLNKPVYVALSILDLSKLLIYEFHYNCIKRKCNANLLFKDTESLVYKDKNFFDFSDYPEDSKFFDLASKNIIGKMKREFKGKIIGEFFRLKTKMDSLFDVDNGENEKRKESTKMLLKRKKQRMY